MFSLAYRLIQFATMALVFLLFWSISPAVAIGWAVFLVILTWRSARRLSAEIVRSSLLPAPPSRH